METSRPRRQAGHDPAISIHNASRGVGVAALAAPALEERCGVTFEDWIAPHWPAMRRVAERLAGAGHRDDVLQEALAAAWRHWNRFDPERGTAQAWLLGITANHARKALRSARRHEALVDVPVDGELGANLDLQRAVRALPARQRLAVELYYYVGLPLNEVAAVMGCAEGTVKSTLAAVRAKLRAALGEDYR